MNLQSFPSAFYQKHFHKFDAKNTFYFRIESWLLKIFCEEFFFKTLVILERDREWLWQGEVGVEGSKGEGEGEQTPL